MVFSSKIHEFALFTHIISYPHFNCYILYIAVTTLEVLHSPKDTQIEEHDTVFLVCKFKSSTKIKVWWEKQGDLILNELTRQVSTTQFKSNNDFMVSFIIL